MRQLLVVKELLSQGKSVRITVRGNSMRPHLVHERDYVLLQPAKTVKVGDIALAEVSPLHFVLHRVVRIDGERVTMRGDGNPVGTELCTLSDICGTVAGFIRKGRDVTESPSTVGYRLYSWLWMHTLPLRRYMLAAHNLFFHSCKDLNRLTPRTCETEAFLSLLRSTLWENTGDVEAIFAATDKPRWEVIWNLASEQKMLGHIADAVRRLPVELQPTGELSERIAKARFSRMMMLQHKQLNEGVLKAFACLQKNGLSPFLLKGQGNAARYPIPQLRQCGDIDIYIGQKDYERAKECFRELVGSENFEKSHEGLYHISFMLGANDIELHREIGICYNVLSVQKYRSFARKWLTKERADMVRIAGEDIRVPGRLFNVVYVYQHAWYHFVREGVGIRQLCDWTMLLHDAYGKIDVSELGRELKSMHMLHGWQLFGYIAVNYLGLPEPEMPFYNAAKEKQAKDVWTKVLDGGNFGQERVRNMSDYRNGLKKSILLFAQSMVYYLSMIRLTHGDSLGALFLCICVRIKHVFIRIFKR